MSATTAQAIYDRVSSLVADAPFSYVRSNEPFSTEQMPRQALDRTFYLQQLHESSEGYLGFATAEIDRLRINLVRLTNRDPHGCYRQLMVDVGSMQAAVVRDGTAADYNAECIGWEIPEPPVDADFILGWIEFSVDFDRAL